MFNILLQKDNYTLIDMGYQYVVANGFDEFRPENQKWDNGTYFTHWNQSAKDKQAALSAALDLFRYRTEENYISRSRLEEIATLCKDGLIEDDEVSAMEYLTDTVGLTENECEFFGVDYEEMCSYSLYD